jgi:acyl-coenzyme A thioesterase PaaI-like protein
MAVKVNVKDTDLKALIDFFVQKSGHSFNDVLDFSLDSPTLEEGIVTFELRDELIGNPIFRTLHGGVISSILDLTGGHTVHLQVFKEIRDKPFDKQIERISKIGTIDLRIDYLRPGRGKHFTAKGSILRMGKKVAVTRMELRNEESVLIAVGTGTYTVG